MQIVIPTIFGLESLVKQELIDIGYESGQITANNGQILFEASQEDLPKAVARCNIWLRTAERVLIKVGGGRAVTFDQLFNLSLEIPWEKYIPDRWAFHVNGYSRKSDLFGISACQAIVKKSIVKRISDKKGLKAGANLPEDENTGLIKITFSIVDNNVTFMLDTSGDGLHKRGYRPLSHAAPIKETLAAALVLLSQWNVFKDEAIIDPMCGSGTIPIEAALIAMNIAPGINRSFAAEKWPLITKKVFDKARQEALDLQRSDYPDRPFIFGGDIDKRNVELSKDNANRANVKHLISFQETDVRTFDFAAIQKWTNLPRALVITNPPYGERLMEKENALDLFRDMGRIWIKGKNVVNKLRISIIAPLDVFEESFGAVADKRRKLYNGMIPCNMYHYFKSIREDNKG